jgi:Papain-like cysteine protease AvrRpt2
MGRNKIFPSIFCLVFLFACEQKKVKIQLQDCPSASDSCVSYAVPGYLYPMQQRHEFDCWATVLTMLESWKDQHSHSTEEIMRSFGTYYLNLYNKSSTQGIGIEDEVRLYQLAGLEIERQLDPSIKGWQAYLADFGPLSITIDARPPYGGTVHALLIVGIQGSITGWRRTL